MENVKKYFAEFLGTFLLTLFGCGAAVLVPFFGGSPFAIAAAFGLVLTVCAYSFGHISGCHVNPAVSFAFLLEGKIDPATFIGYVISQCAGAICAGCVLTLTVSVPLHLGVGHNALYCESFTLSMVVESILTAVFVFAVLAVSAREEMAAVAPLAVGAALCLVHIIGLPLTGTSVNPARSLVALFTGKADIIDALPVFIVAPFIGAAVAAGLHLFFMSQPKVSEEISEKVEEISEPAETEAKEECENLSGMVDACQDDTPQEDTPPEPTGQEVAETADDE